MIAFLCDVIQIYTFFLFLFGSKTIRSSARHVTTKEKIDLKTKSDWVKGWHVFIDTQATGTRSGCHDRFLFFVFLEGGGAGRGEREEIRLLLALLLVRGKESLVLPRGKLKLKRQIKRKNVIKKQMPFDC